MIFSKQAKHLASPQMSLESYQTSMMEHICEYSSTESR